MRLRVLVLDVGAKAWDLKRRTAGGMNARDHGKVN